MDTRREFLKKAALFSGATAMGTGYDERFAGRVETGASGMTDPLMGEVV
jgi:hypothetical protein